MFNTFIYNPLYNALVGILDVVPGGNVFFAVIILTIIVKTILFPLTKKSIITQIKSRALNDELKEIKVEFKNDREKLGRKTLELYRKHKINPFASLFLIIIQIPIIFALFYIFAQSGLPTINSEILYSFIPNPESVQMTIAGFDLAQKSFFFAFLAAVTQFFYMKRMLVTTPPKKKEIMKKDVNEKKKDDFVEDITKAMNAQMLYVLPVIIFFAGYGFSAVVALYWTVSNLYTYLQDIYIKKNMKDSGDGDIGGDQFEGKDTIVVKTS